MRVGIHSSLHGAHVLMGAWASLGTSGPAARDAAVSSSTTTAACIDFQAGCAVTWQLPCDFLVPAFTMVVLELLVFENTCALMHVALGALMCPSL